MNWLQWIGYYHPAELLSISGAHSSGYFQEDEGFQKEPCLRTYITAIVDSETQAVWHFEIAGKLYFQKTDKSTSICINSDKRIILNR